MRWLVVICSVLLLASYVSGLPTARSFFGHRRDSAVRAGLKHLDHIDTLSNGVLLAQPAVIDGGGSVVVRWDNIADAQLADSIAVYCPFDKDQDIGDFLDLVPTNGTRSGEVTFSDMINMRCNYGFRYLRANTAYPDCDASVRDCLAMEADASACEVFHCPDGCVHGHDLYGTFNYTHDSGICRAAIHAGVLPATGGTVHMDLVAGQDNYVGSTRNGITSQSYNQFWNFTVIPRATTRAVGGWRYAQLALSNEVTMAGGNQEPTQVHLALTNDPTQMRILWTSDAPNPVVHFGTRSKEYTHRATGSSRTYTASMMCESPSNTTAQQFFRPPGLLHNVLLEDLQEGVQYFYIVGSDTVEHATEPRERTFEAQVSAGADKEAVIIAYGDMGVPDDVGDGSIPTITTIGAIEHNRQVIVHFGDLSYARGLGYVWEQFLNNIEFVTESTPYMVSVGNHDYCHEAGGIGHDPSGVDTEAGWHPSWGDYGDDSAGECGVPTYYRFAAPPTGNSVFWYSFDQRNVHVIQLSTEHNFTMGSPQMQWLWKDLQAVNRTLTPYVILTGHRPMYTSQMYEGDYVVSEHMQLLFEDLLYEYKVRCESQKKKLSFEANC
eukprot:TRINITY_DN1734_c0_g1_i1.p1 TRINITY_DN1734_c0_g1~~TRINITY_DN1734_c0_g1_i1.p1  ORF type:complete len:606 (+),score=69.93 TRINITY_DN1734_c0_g1_i1:44-1861(+)